MVEKNKVNLSAKKTEAGWGEANDNFFLSATPIWFEWLKWILILGAIQVIANKTQDRLVQLINGISYIFLLYYMIGFFYNIEFHGIPLIKSERKRQIISLMLSLLLFSGVYYLLTHLASQLKT